MDIAERNLLDAETAIVGSLLISPEICGELALKVKATDFVDSSYRHIYEAAMEVFSACKPVDPVTICAAAGEEYEPLLRKAMIATPTAANWQAYSDALLEHSRLSRLKSAALAIVDAPNLTTAKAAMAQAETLMMDNRGKRKVSFAQGLREFLARQAEHKAPNYLPWGVRTLEEHLYAEPGDLVILAGEPSTGKTLLAAQFAYNMAIKNKCVGIYTLETSDSKLYDRLFSGAANLPFDGIKRRSLTDAQLLQASQELGYYADRISYDINPAAGMTVADIQADALSSRYDVIFIDYLQLIAGPGDPGSYERITSTSLGLHTMSQRTGIAVIALSQLSRPEKSTKARTQVRMNDLRGSGQIEQDADVIMALTLEIKDDKSGPRKLSVIKNKEGEADGFVRFGFDSKNLALRPLTGRYLQNDLEPKFSRLPDDGQLEMPFEEATSNAGT